MPTSKQLAQQTKRILAARKQDIVGRVVAASFEILHNSYLSGSSLWPKNGFKAGHGLGSGLKDCIHIVVNAYGIDSDPIVGRVGMNIHNTSDRRLIRQVSAIKMIFDYTVHNDIYFEDELRNTQNKLWFTFTIDVNNTQPPPQHW